MDPHEDRPVVTLTAWVSAKPYWEQYAWKLNFEKDSLTDGDIDRCYQYLCEHLDLLPSLGDELPISFPEIPPPHDDSPPKPAQPRISGVKDFQHVNAIASECAIPFGSNLTLIYGENGSGKSGIARLLCDACFSRGEREILPNVRRAPGTAKANFVMDDGSIIPYSRGDRHESLKRYSVFDSKSVLIHLDESNSVNFTPAQIRIFDKVAATIATLEDKLTGERRARKVDNPFHGMFSDDASSPTAVFCKGISGSTKVPDFLPHATFDPKSDGDRLDQLERQIEEKRRLDIPSKKAQLASDRAGLSVLKTSLQRVTDHFTEEKRERTNQLIWDIVEKKTIAEALSVETFDDGVLKTVGSAEWRALLVAAKALHEAERASHGSDPEHCMLCHQKLTAQANVLFARYWEFLESKAQSELAALFRRRDQLLRELRLLQMTCPRLLETDAGVKVLTDGKPEYLGTLKTNLDALEHAVGDWIQNIEAIKEIVGSVTLPDLREIDRLIGDKLEEEKALADPAPEIAALTAQLNAIKDRKKVSAVKDAALEYIAYLQWDAKADFNFFGIKMATTKKRTEWFLAGVASNYKGLFNSELHELGRDFNLVMLTSGEQGNTVKEYRLDFAEDYAPSQILSEGEQNACALADFLTEVQLDKNNSGIILDDPVTSLDHERKDKIARRLAQEAFRRQVIVFTHDLVFASKLAKHAAQANIPMVAHWMRKIAGVPGHGEANSSPKVATLTILKQKCGESVRDLEHATAADQERGLERAFDYLRSCCEALIEEVLFAGTIERYRDHVRVQNLEEMVFHEGLALQIVGLHERLSEFIPAHNRSDLQRGSPLSMADFDSLWREFERLERDLKAEHKKAKVARGERKRTQRAAHAGWP